MFLKVSEHKSLDNDIFLLSLLKDLQNNVNALSIRHAGIGEFHLYRHTGCESIRKKLFFFIEIASTDTFFGGNSDDFT